MWTVGIVGATGVVGSLMRQLLEERAFPVRQLRVFASPRSVGRELSWKGKGVVCEALRPGIFEGCDWVFFDVSDELAREWVPDALRAGARVVDSSAAFRLDPSVSLGVPEVNAESAILPAARAGAALFAAPNCVVVPLTLPLKVLGIHFGRLEKVIVSTYQSTSGAGFAAQERLRKEVLGLPLEGEKSPFPGPIAFNCFPQIGSCSKDALWEGAFTGEEKKIREETRKILGLPDLSVVATAVRVPTQVGHAQSVYVRCEQPIERALFWEALHAFLGVDCPYPYPTVLSQRGKDGVGVGRVRMDPDDSRAVHFWVSADNLRKGAALNALQIAECVLQA